MHLEAKEGRLKENEEQVENGHGREEMLLLGKRLRKERRTHWTEDAAVGDDGVSCVFTGLTERGDASAY